jgi:hypothetical protein
MRSLPVLPTLPEPLSPGGPAPPWPHQPTVEWQVCGACNYDCSYCIQAPAHRVGFPSAEEIDRSLAFLAALPGRWEIKMTGGEPFVSRLFLDRIVPGLIATPHQLSVLTNLSAPPRALARFARLSRGRLAVVSASLHLQHTSTAAFLDRLRVVRDEAGAGPRFVVNCVLDPERLPAVRAARATVEAAGFTFFPQLMKVKQGIFAYRPEQLALVDEIVGGLGAAAEARSANLAPAYTGRRCWTGARYLVLLQSGDAWSCRSARRQGEGYLGNVHAGGVALREGPVACRYTICPCAVPANRGMIEGVAARGLGAEVGT